MSVSESHNRKGVRLLGRVWIRLQMESSVLLSWPWPRACVSWIIRLDPKWPPGPYKWKEAESEAEMWWWQKQGQRASWALEMEEAAKSQGVPGGLWELEKPCEAHAILLNYGFVLFLSLQSVWQWQKITAGALSFSHSKGAGRWTRSQAPSISSAACVWSEFQSWACLTYVSCGSLLPALGCDFGGWVWCFGEASISSLLMSKYGPPGASNWILCLEVSPVPLPPRCHLCRCFLEDAQGKACPPLTQSWGWSQNLLKTSLWSIPE